MVRCAKSNAATLMRSQKGVVIHNIYKTGELDEPSTCAKIAQVQKESGITMEPEGMRPLVSLERYVRSRRSEGAGSAASEDVRVCRRRRRYVRSQ